MLSEKIDLLLKKSIDMGLDGVEVYVAKGYSRTFKIVNDRIAEALAEEEYNIGIRGYIGKKVGAIRTNNLDDIDKVLETLVRVTRSSPEDPYWSGFPSDNNPPLQVQSYDPRVANKSEEDYVDLILHAMDRFKEPALVRGAERAVVVEGTLNVTSGSIIYTNTNGVYREEPVSRVLFWMQVNIEKSGSSTDFSMEYYKSILDEREIEKKAIEHGERALLFFNSKPIESGEYNVLFTPKVAGLIVSTALAPAFSGLNILENRSPLKNKLGEQVFNERVSIVDEPGLLGAIGTRGVDDEGVVTKKKKVVDKGVFTTILHSYYTARRMNTETTGNGIRRHPAAQPQPGFTNLVLETGRGNLEEFMRDVKKGLVVYDAIGYWMSDPFTGGVKETVTHGLLVEGNEVKPVKGVVIGGNIYEWLSKGLVEIGDDAEIFGSQATPTLWISGVKIAGK